MDTIRKCMAKLTIMHALPFSIAEYEYLSDFLKIFNSRFMQFLGEHLQKSANKPQSSDSTASRGAHENKWGTSVKSERPLTPEWSHCGLVCSA
ncbi:hypothetical protein EJ110_NYTH52024 [Nymphaea thermarum]|nr:hypothetical protein EJ110_NYTH52024 [Nymphaea thermarum]